MASENSTAIYNLHGMLIVRFHVSIWTPWGQDALCAIRPFLVLPGLISTALPHVLFFLFFFLMCYLFCPGETPRVTLKIYPSPFFRNFILDYVQLPYSYKRLFHVCIILELLGDGAVDYYYCIIKWFYINRSFSTVLTKACPFFLFWARLIQTMNIYC